jgi:hypothetical protein
LTRPQVLLQRLATLCWHDVWKIPARRSASAGGALVGSQLCSDSFTSLSPCEASPAVMGVVAVSGAVSCTGPAAFLMDRSLSVTLRTISPTLVSFLGISSSESDSSEMTQSFPVTSMGFPSESTRRTVLGTSTPFLTTLPAAISYVARLSVALGASRGSRRCWRTSHAVRMTSLGLSW